ncbi:MAG: MFS transporter [Candidatus Desulfatibia sp.]|uniref:MFS transporter n=1 Tax=Candidatus Desulfatibia sp. TaxID=3101189 RepID=UPI002F2EEF99
MKRISLNRKLLWIVLGLMVFSQLIYLYVNVRSYQNKYSQVVRSNLHTVGISLQENLNNILEKGISVKKLFGLKALLKEILSDAPELAFIAIHEPSGPWLYYCDRKIFLKGQELSGRNEVAFLSSLTSEASLSFNLQKPGEAIQGELVLGVNQELIASKVKEIALDTGTIILVSILATIDFLFFIIAYTITLPLRKVTAEIQLAHEKRLISLAISRTGIDFLDYMLLRFEQYRSRFKEEWINLTAISRSLTKASGKYPGGPLARESLANMKTIIDRFHLGGETWTKTLSVESPVLIRPTIFLFVFAEALSISFLPLYAKELYRPLLNLSEEVVLGLPIAAFMLFTVISLPMGGAWSDIFGRKKAFLTGAVISAAGLFLSGTADDILELIIYRAIVGFGFGTVYMTVQGYIVDVTSTSNRAEGMAIFLSAFYGGTLCGSAIGGMVADRVGFSFLFYMGAVIAVASIFFMYMFIEEKSIPGHHEGRVQEMENWFKVMINALPSPRMAVKFLSDRNFAALTIFQSIPNKICLIGLVYYLAPLILKDLGTTQSDTGRCIMLYSLIMIILSQGVSKWSDRSFTTKAFIFWGGIFSGLALVPFLFWTNTFTVALSIIMLGLAHTLSVANQAKLASQLKVVKEAGLGPGLGIYRQVERVGNVVAPIILGALASYMGYAKSLALIGIYTAFSSLLFLLIYKEEST